MLKFLPGILLLQMITVGLVLLLPVKFVQWEWLRLVVPLLVVGLLTAFWLGSVAAHQRKDALQRLQENHAKEREGILMDAERDKAKIVKQAHRETLQEVRRSSTHAKIKVGVAFLAAAGVGGALLLTQFMTMGLFLLSTAGGGLGGYLLRIRQEKGRPLLAWKQGEKGAKALPMKEEN